jgi:hypothetical protein
VTDTLGRPRIGATALGRLHLRVTRAGTAEDVILERRWPDPERARAWCEGVVGDRAGEVELQEARVFTERWQHPKPWEPGHARAVPESVQSGWPDGRRGIAWSAAERVVAVPEGR